MDYEQVLTQPDKMSGVKVGASNKFGRIFYISDFNSINLLIFGVCVELLSLPKYAYHYQGTFLIDCFVH